MNMQIERNGRVFCIQQTTEGGADASHGSCILYQAHLNGACINALGIGGVGTDPEYRRAGLVRNFLQKANELAASENCPITVLHPFSFAYYRKFGFERVADHRILEFPITALEFVPRYEKLIRCTGAEAAELTALYNTFAQTRNLMFRRSEDYPWPLEHGAIYLSRDAHGTADGYLFYEIENHLNINHMERGVLHVREFAFTSPAALDRLLGFMRMFDGELERVVLHNTAMAPEVERRLRHYTHTTITVLPDLMVRINDVEAILKAVRYPMAKGSFTVKVTDAPATADTAETILGVWQVTYENGTAEVLRLADDAACDLCADRRAFAQLVFGYESYGADAARYMHGVALYGDCDAFFRAFPNRPCGLFEHF